MYRINESCGNLVGIWTDGQLSDADTSALARDLEARMCEHDQLRLLFRAEGPGGWDSAAALRLTRFGLRHAAHVERLAVVGEPELETCIDRLIVQNTGVRARHFLPAELGRAWLWLQKETETSPAPVLEMHQLASE